MNLTLRCSRRATAGCASLRARLSSNVRRRKHRHTAAMTTSERLFERYCDLHGLSFERVAEGASPTPDYLVVLGGVPTVFEIKQLDDDESFSSVRATRTLGDHVRAKINEARGQVRSAAQRGSPAILLIYNNLDPLQAFGTEQHDFVAAMYGEPTVTVSVETGAILDSYEGRNKSFRAGKNEAFSAVGHLKQGSAGPHVHLYENVYAKVPLIYDRLPPFLTISRFDVATDSDAEFPGQRAR